MDPAEAYQAFLDLGARYMLPMHWGTFQLTHEPLDEPAAELRRVIAAAGGDPTRAPILGIGESWHVPPREAAAQETVAHNVASASCSASRVALTP
jgi:L-ascorbate metabolism protein UlaG (beta-lactamase superfamily)